MICGGRPAGPRRLSGTDSTLWSLDRSSVAGRVAGRRTLPHSSTRKDARQPSWRASSPPGRRKPSPQLSGWPSAAVRRRSSRCTCSPHCSSSPTASRARCSRPWAPTRPTSAPRPRRRCAACPASAAPPCPAPSPSRELLRVLNAAGEQASALGDEYVSTEHLLVGLADSGGEAGTVLTSAGATRDALLAAFRTVRGTRRSPPPTPRAPSRRWRSTPSTSPSGPATARSTRSSAGTPRSAASSRCCPGAPRTTPS